VKIPATLSLFFGYNNLVVDMLGFSVLKDFSYPVLFDVTHALQRPGGLGDAAAGRRETVRELALAGLSQKIAGLFLEAHPEPEKALCDGPCALRLNQLEPFLKQMKAMDELVKTFEPLDTA
jgi:2-dehydro-3-deoxyphosphooctonate aldolase (KDO 8-P synthase)